MLLFCYSLIWQYGSVTMRREKMCERVTEREKKSAIILTLKQRHLIWQNFWFRYKFPFCILFSFSFNSTLQNHIMSYTQHLERRKDFLKDPCYLSWRIPLVSWQHVKQASFICVTVQHLTTFRVEEWGPWFL